MFTVYKRHFVFIWSLQVLHQSSKKSQIGNVRVHWYYIRQKVCFYLNFRSLHQSRPNCRCENALCIMEDGSCVCNSTCFSMIQFFLLVFLEFSDTHHYQATKCTIRCREKLKPTHLPSIAFSNITNLKRKWQDLISTAFF